MPIPVTVHQDAVDSATGVARTVLFKMYDAITTPNDLPETKRLLMEEAVNFMDDNTERREVVTFPANPLANACAYHFNDGTLIIHDMTSGVMEAYHIASNEEKEQLEL